MTVYTRIYEIDFEVDNGVSYDKDSAIVLANSEEEAVEMLRGMINGIDSETCISKIFKVHVFTGNIFTGKHGWK